MANWFSKYLTGLLNFYSMGAYNQIRKAFNGSSDTSGIESLVNKYTGGGLTGAEVQQNQFNHDEAELAYQRQVDFYNQFQSPQAQVQQYQQAGLNPALMYNSGAGSPSAMSAPQASGNGGHSQSDLISTLLSLVSISEQVKNYKVERELKASQADNLNIETDIRRKELNNWDRKFDLFVNSTEANIRNTDAQTAYAQASEELARANIKKSEAESAWIGFQSQIAKVDSENRQAMIDSQLELNKVQRKLIIAETKLKYAQEGKTSIDKQKVEEELSILKDQHDSLVSEAKARAEKLEQDGKLSKKDVDWYEKNYNIRACGLMMSAMSSDNFSKDVISWTKWHDTSRRYLNGLAGQM